MRFEIGDQVTRIAAPSEFKNSIGKIGTIISRKRGELTDKCVAPSFYVVRFKNDFDFSFEVATDDQIKKLE